MTQTTRALPFLPATVALAMCGACGATSTLEDAGSAPDASTRDGGAGLGEDAGRDLDAGPPAAPDAGPSVGFDDSSCTPGPTHHWSDKSATLFSAGDVHAESRPHADFVIGGSFGETVRLGTEALTANGVDGYVALIDADGRFVWSQHFGGSGRQRVTGVARDGAGNVIVFGDLTEELTIGAETRAGQSPDEADLFLASFTPSGTMSWLRTFVGAGRDDAGPVTADAMGNVYVAGAFDDPLLLDGNVVSADAPGISSSRGSFVASFDASGNYRWSRGYPSFATFVSMTADADGNVYATGRYRLGRDLGAGPLPEPTGGADAFVVSYGADGGARWTRTLSGPGFDVGEAITTNAGLVVVVGRFKDSLNGGLVGLGRQDMFVATYDADGSPGWSQALGGTGFASADAVSVDDSGNVLIAGRIGDTLALLSGPAIEGRGLLLLSLTPAGECRWIHHIPTRVAAATTGLAFGDGSQLFFAGWANGPIDLGGGAFPNGAGIFVASMR